MKHPHWAVESSMDLRRKQRRSIQPVQPPWRFVVLICGAFALSLSLSLSLGASPLSCRPCAVASYSYCGSPVAGSLCCCIIVWGRFFSLRHARRGERSSRSKCFIPFFPFILFSYFIMYLMHVTLVSLSVCVCVCVCVCTAYVRCTEGYPRRRNTTSFNIHATEY